MVHYFVKAKEIGGVLNIYICPIPEELQPITSVHYVQISV